MTSADERALQASFGQNLSYLVSITHSFLGKLTAGIYASRGLTTHQWKVMSILYYWPPLPAVRMTSLCTLDKAAISRGVAGLLKLKLARRYLDDETGAICITLTDSGRTMYAAIAAEMSQLQKRLLANVSESERDAFFTTLAKIGGSLRAASHRCTPDQAGRTPRSRSRKSTSGQRRVALDSGTRRARPGIALKV
jgi:DNA-binding MarR family transcriptional regulator